MSKKFIIMRRSAQVKGKASNYASGYRKLALVEIDQNKLRKGDVEPRMISNRARGVVKVHDEANVWWGQGIRSEGKRYLENLQAKCAALNLKS